MMKWVHRLLGLLLLVVLVGLLFRVLLPALEGGGSWSVFLGELEGNRNAVVVMLITIIIGLVAYVLTGFSATSKAQYLSYETQQGSISISIKALQDFLGHLRGEFPTILSLHPRVTALDESLDVVMEVRVRSGAPIPEISRMLQERTRSLIQEKIGIAEIHGIEIKVEEIVKDKDTKSQEITPLPPPAGEVTGS